MKVTTNTSLTVFPISVIRKYFTTIVEFKLTNKSLHLQAVLYL